jgi:soluble lytic murein transglycosylase
VAVGIAGALLGQVARLRLYDGPGPTGTPSVGTQPSDTLRTEPVSGTLGGAPSDGAGDGAGDGTGPPGAGAAATLPAGAGPGPGGRRAGAAAGGPTATPRPPTAAPWREAPFPAALATARGLARDGEPALAEATVRAVLAGPEPAARQAAGELARVLWDRGEAAAALDALEAASAGGGPAALPVPARLLYAEALEAAGRTEAALAAYDSYLAAVPAMAAEVGLSRGQLLFLAGRYEAALADFRRARDGAVDTRSASLAALRTGNALLQVDDPRGALAAYRDAFDRADNDADRAQALAGEIAALIEGGDTPAAHAVRRRLVRELPDQALAAAALGRLKEAGQAVPPEDEAGVLNAGGDPAAAVRLLTSTLGAGPLPSSGRAVALADAYRSQGDDTAALAVLDAALAGGADGATGAAALLRAEILADLDRHEEAVLAYEAAAARGPDLAGDALWARSTLLDRLADPRAAGAYAAMAEAAPGHGRAAEARFRAGLAAWRQGRPAEAAAQWSLGAEVGAGQIGERSRAGYWLGRAAAAMGDLPTAESWWRRVQDGDPLGYYGLLSAERLGQPPAPAAAGAGPPQEATWRWLASWRPGLDAAGWQQARAGVAARDEVARAQAWLDLGRPAAARADLTALGRSLGEDLAARAALAWEAERLGVPRAAMALAEGVLAAAPPAARLTAPAAFLRLAYPQGYGALVRSEAAANGLSPALLFALVRQESAFEPGIRSSAGAVGLTQIMPDTGQHLADRLGLAAFQVEDLRRPATNIRLGAHFLGSQLAAYDGEVAPALAAYNGGPGNAARWWPEAGGDPALFVEGIDYPETASYVKRVLAGRAAYERLGVR